jgi:hypothetical protein
MRKKLVIARSDSDKAIQRSIIITGLLRYTRNDGQHVNRNEFFMFCQEESGIKY